MEIIYADSLILLNALIDYLVLLAAGRINGLPLRRWRLALAAAFGGAYALASVLWPGFFALAAVKILAGLAMTAIAYGLTRRFLRLAVTVFAVAAAFAGAVYALAGLAGLPRTGGLYIPVSTRVLLLSFAVCYALLSLVFRGRGRRAEKKLYRVELTFRGKTVRFTALDDSGNELCDPISGGGVLVAQAETLAPLFDDPALLYADPAEALPRMNDPRFRLLPCTCAAAESALLLCFRPDSVKIDGRARPDLLAAVARNALSPAGDYQAIV